MMRRVALHRPRREEIEALQRQIEECEDDESRLTLEAKLKSLTEKSLSAFPISIRSTCGIAASKTSRSLWRRP